MRAENLKSLARRPRSTYVDTSVWCAYCFNEESSEQAVAWLSEVDLSQVGASWWVQTEFESALGIQVRKGALSKRQAEMARQKFAEVLTMVRALNVIEQDFAEAAKSCQDAASGLRGGDALHLVVAQRHGCTSLASLDTKMQANAQQLGFKLIDWQ
jgi:uncharacterized protein